MSHSISMRSLAINPRAEGPNPDWPLQGVTQVSNLDSALGQLLLQLVGLVLQQPEGGKHKKISLRFKSSIMYPFRYKLNHFMLSDLLWLLLVHLSYLWNKTILDTTPQIKQSGVWDGGRGGGKGNLVWGFFASMTRVTKMPIWFFFHFIWFFFHFMDSLFLFQKHVSVHSHFLQVFLQLFNVDVFVLNLKMLSPEKNLM